MIPLSGIYTALFRFKHDYFMNSCNLTARHAAFALMLAIVIISLVASLITFA